MTYEEATAKVSELKARFDRPFDATDKAVIETLYIGILGILCGIGIFLYQKDR